jgi:hypothetical protein
VVRDAGPTVERQCSFVAALSWPDLFRPSTSFYVEGGVKTWMRGTSPRKTVERWCPFVAAFITAALVAVANQFKIGKPVRATRCVFMPLRFL